MRSARARYIVRGKRTNRKKPFFSFSRSEKLRTEILISPSAHLSHTKTGQTKEILHSARNMPADKVNLFHTQGFFCRSGKKNSEWFVIFHPFCFNTPWPKTIAEFLGCELHSHWTFRIVKDNFPFMHILALLSIQGEPSPVPEKKKKILPRNVFVCLLLPFLIWPCASLEKVSFPLFSL